MYRNHCIGVVVPAYNEELLIGRSLESMPDFVDHIVVVDDCTRATTVQLMAAALEVEGAKRIFEYDRIVVYERRGAPRPP